MTHVCTTHKRLALALAALSFFFLAACGGGGDGGNPFFAAPPGSISGVATKGPVSGATVKAFAMSSGVAGRQIGIATTDANGAFTMAIGDHAGAVMLQLTGGTYTDEATGTTMPMASVDGMTAVLPGIVAGRDTTGIQMTPLTTMAQAMAQNMAGGMTPANITAANAALGNYFMTGDILHTPPMNPLVAGSGAASNPAAVNYGMTLAAMSQYAKGLGLDASSGMVTAMTRDASDGVMDGRTAAGPIGMGGGMGGGMMSPAAGTADLADAMRDFVGSAMNRSGMTVADMVSLMQHLHDGDGHMH